jgi:hypothetical protein
MTKPNPQGPVESNTTLDHFTNIENLRLKPSFVEASGVKKLRTHVPVRKPLPQEYVRTHPNADYRNTFAVIELKHENEEYLVLPHVVPSLITEVVYKTIYTAISRQGVVFLWPVRLPTPDDRDCAWWDTAQQAAELGTTKWVRMKSNKALGAYEITVAEIELPDPEWPKESFVDLLRIAFGKRLVTDLDHQLVKKLQGSPRCLTASAKWWWWTSSSPPPTASDQYRFAWSPPSCAAGADFESGETNSVRYHPMQRAQTSCLWLTTPRLSSAAISPSIGRCRCASSTCSSSSEI